MRGLHLSRRYKDWQFIQSEEHKEQDDDLISRQAVLDVIKSMSNANPSYWNKCDVVDREDLIDAISELSPVTTEPKTGHWIDKDDKSAVCSCCNRNNTLFGDYCKWCGARMVEPQEKRCEDCTHYGKLSLDCGRCDDDCSMYEPRESDHKCYTCKHYTSGEYDGSCGSYICKGYSDWESEE